MRPRTRLKSSPFPLSPMKATFRLGSVGIGPDAPCAWLCGDASARRAVSTAPTVRRAGRAVCRTSRRIVIPLGADFITTPLEDLTPEIEQRLKRDRLPSAGAHQGPNNTLSP